ncbi:hypothetical protein FB645_003726 [Coemansia sp. IMI 203386]|nr:hypothetical protein FB645_003726 [Coemansia sp. IMI 203386]
MNLFTVSVLSLLCMAPIASAQGVLAPSNTMDSKEQRYERGVLVANGVQKSCELVPIGEVGAFVAASCLDAKQAKNYTAHMFVNTGFNTVDKIDFGIDSVHFYQLYNQQTLDYNIAIVNFNRKKVQPIYTRITDFTKPDRGFLYSRIELDEQLNPSKEYTNLVQHPNSDYTCNGPVSINELLSASAVCTTLKQQFDQDDKRELPYGSVLLADNGTEYPYALYSHSIIDVSDANNPSGTMYSYYMVLLYYADFAKQVFGADLSFIIDGVNSVVTGTNSVSPIESKFNGTKKLVIFDDLYSDNGEGGEVDMLTETDGWISTAKDEDQHATPSTDGSSEADDDLPKKGLSSGAIAGIAVVCSIAGIVILAAIYRYVRIVARNRSAENYWNQKVETLRSTKDVGLPSPVSAR